MAVMSEGENAPIVLVAGKEDFLNKLKHALADTHVALLHAETHRDAVRLLERLRTEIDLAIIELENSNGWELIGDLTRHPIALRIIATTSVYPDSVLKNARSLGVDAVLPETTAPEEWRKTVEAVLRKSESA